MKISLSILAIVALSGFAAIEDVDSENTGQETLSVLENPSIVPGTAFQDAPQQSIVETPAPLPVQPQPSIQEPFPAGEPLILDQQGAIVQNPIVTDGCQICCCQSCCCPSPPTPTVFCLIDPSGCSHEACIDVPACCAGEQPVVSWRCRLFGRKVATLCWPCCNREVRVVITRRGKVKVRD